VEVIQNETLSGRFLVSGKGKDKVVPMLNQVPRHEEVLEEWRHSSTLS
jgi:hypothetical protein